MCVEAILDTTSLRVKHIGAGRSHGLAGKTGFKKWKGYIELDKHDIMISNSA